MNYWFILHDLPSYLAHKDKIGHTQRNRIAGIKKGDKIVYYAIRDGVIIGIFEVVSIIQNDKVKRWGPKEWYWFYKIKPLILAEPPFYTNIKKLKEDKNGPNFLKRNLHGITRIEINSKDFNKILKFLKQKPSKEKLFSEYTTDEGIGEDNDLKIMKHEPTNEQGVVVLFAKNLDKLGFSYFEFIRSGFPDACVLKKEKDGKMHRKYIEFEYKSSQFKQHVNNPKHKKIKCDYVVCWENDYLTCPLPVIELKKELL